MTLKRYPRIHYTSLIWDFVTGLWRKLPRSFSLWAMQDYRLDKQELAQLRAAHRAARNARDAYRLNAVILLGSGWSPSEVAAALLIDDDTVRNHCKRYQRGGIAALERMNYVGSDALLSPAQLAELDAYLQQPPPPSAASVARWVKQRFGVPAVSNLRP
ncbi:MAG: helix-turn-helix domain-containing protein [Thiohalocapsa sp.]